MNEINIAHAKFGPCERRTTSSPLVQYDYGQILKIHGIELPTAYEVHFSNDETKGYTTTSIGDEDGVLVPDEYLRTGRTVHAWIYLHEGLEDGSTEYYIMIPVMRRSEPTNMEPTPVQQDAITQAIAALNEAVEQTEADARKTGEDRAAAAGSAEAAERSAAAASGSERAAAGSAEESEAWAVGKRKGADVGSGDPAYHNNSKYYAGEASGYAGAASISAGEASESATRAETAAERAEQIANTSGYLDVEIVNGRLIYTRTAAVDVDFELAAGHLIMGLD